MKDYGPPYQTAGKRQKVAKRSSGRGRHPAEHRWLWRATGVLAMVILTIGLGVSLWFGYQINSGLDQLTVRQDRLQRLQERHDHLGRQRAGLLTQERIQAAARKMGLYPPTAEQVKRL